MKSKNRKVYIYAKLPSTWGDYYFFRINGPGLGNNLFVWGIYQITMKRYDLIPIWPTWIQFNFTKSVTNLIHHVRRTNIGYFISPKNYINGIKKLYFLKTKPKIPFEEFKQFIENNPEQLERFENNIIVVHNMIVDFFEIRNDYLFLKNNFIKCVNERHLKYFDFNFKNSISVHIRLGDFIVSENKESQGENNTRLDIDWYYNLIIQIRKVIGYNIQVFLFSDGTDFELEKILAVPNVKRLNFNSALSDLIGLSKSNFLITSRSTYSMWACYFGRMPAIWYFGKSQKIYYDKPEYEMECPENGILTDDQLKFISEYLGK